MFKEFKTFIMRGNVVDIAVAVIVGAAFIAIVGSLITDVITPLILKPAMDALGVSELEKLACNGVLCGKFIASVINFIVTALIIFFMIKAMNKAKKQKEEEVLVPAGSKMLSSGFPFFCQNPLNLIFAGFFCFQQ
jgi:large conductance mechanosensitive channel